MSAKRSARRDGNDGLGARVESVFEAFSSAVTQWTGSTWGFGAALASLLLWAAAGPFAGFSNDWQLVINTGTTIVTFLMVFLIQRAQNKDARAVQLKLDELILALGGASNSLVDVEELPEKDLEGLKQRSKAMATSARGAKPAKDR